MTPRKKVQPLPPLLKPYPAKRMLYQPHHRSPQDFAHAYGVPDYTLDEMRAMLRQDRLKRIFPSRPS